MRSRRSKIILLILALALVFALVSCASNTTTDTVDKITVAAIAVDTSTIPTAVFAGELDVTQLRIIATMSDGSKEMISVTSGMIALESRSQLDTPGTKTIKIIYQSCEARFQIVLLNKDKKQYTLRVYNGLPIIIDGVALEEDIALEGEYFEAIYDEGTVVTVEWVAVSGFYFDYWTDNDKKIDTQSITQITMDDNHTYKAYSEAVINTVSFVTNCDTGIGVRRTNYLNQGDIPPLSKAGYVFDGWTTVYTVGEAANDNTSVTKISFPYNVRVETTLYGLWRVLGIGYESNPSISPTGVTGYKILSYAKNDTEVSIPDKHNDLPIISIGAAAFENANMLRKLTIPGSVEVIEDGSFKNCSQLSEILIRGTSRTFSSRGGGILYNYDGTQLIAYPANKLTAVCTVEVGVDTIKPYAFYNSLVGGVILPSTIKTIGNNAFNSVHIDYVDLSSVNPNVLNFSLGEQLFNDNINTICVDPSYKNTYMEYTQISNFSWRVNTNVNDLSVIDTDTEKKLLYREIYNENARIPATTSEIIGADRTLTTIRIPVNLHYAVSSIGVEAFNDCILLATVEIPLSSHLERVQDRAFSDTLWVKTLNKQSIIANNKLLKYLGNSAEYTLDTNIKEISEGAFSNNTNLIRLNLTSNADLEYIHAYAFYGCTNFVGDTTTVGGGITLKNRLIGVGSYAFAYTKLPKFALAETSRLAYVSDYAFRGCYYLLSVTFGAMTNEIAPNAFTDCFSLVSFDVQYSSNAVFQAFDGVLYKYDRTFDAAGKPSTIYLYPSGRLDREFDINNPTGADNLSVAIIGSNAFSYSNIAALYIPESVKNISAQAINVPGLIYVKFQVMSTTITYAGMFGQYKPEYVLVADISGAESQTNILNYFNNDQDLRDEKYEENSLDTLSIYSEGANPAMVYALREGALRLARADRSVSEINIPAAATGGLSVTSVGEYAFYGYYLTEVHFGGNESSLAPHAFSQAVNMYKLYTVEGKTTVPTISSTTFSGKFDNGLMIYVSYDGGIKQNYLTLWNLSSDKYLINLSTGLAVAKFSGIEIGDVEDLAGVINESNVPIPIRAGYQFAGWQDDNNQIIDISGAGYVVPYNITLICKWEAKVYEIVFSIESNASMSQTVFYVTYDEAYTFPEATYPNMLLSKWRTAAHVEYPSEGIWAYALIDDSITLYPVWVDKYYKLVFEHDDALTVDGTDRNVLFGQTYTLPVPEKEGLIFVGWCLKNEVNGTISEPITNKDGESYLRWSIESSEEYPTYTVSPKWENKTVTVNLYLQYTDETDNILFATKQVPYGQPFTFVFEDYYHEGTGITYYKDRFCGWYKDYDAASASGMGKRYCDEDGFGLFNWDVGVDCNLFAQWPIEISDGNALTALLGADLTKSYILTNDITITRPIGSKDNPYSGVFNGNGYTVTFSYTDLSTFDGYVGMFAYNQGTIKNVKLIANIDIVCDDIGTKYIGGLVGYNTGKIYSTAVSGYDVKTNMLIRINANNNTDTYNVNIGGLAGANSGTIYKIGLRVDRLNILVFDAAADDYITYLGTDYNMGNTIGVLEGGVLDGTGRSSVYYYTNDNDRLKNVVCGKIISGTVIAFSPSASKIP